MAIKFKCTCGHVLSVPDSAAGKTGKCPKCQKALRVPKPKSKPAPAAAAAPAPAAPGLDALFDEAGLVQKTGPVCPGCGIDIKPGTRVCTSCGFNLESGERMAGFEAASAGREFQNEYLQEAADNMVRDKLMDSRREKAAMPWWVLMSILFGAITLCAAGIVIADRLGGTEPDPSTFLGRLQLWPIMVTLGTTVLLTGASIAIFAHLDVCVFAFKRTVGQGFLCLFLPWVYSLVYACMNFKDNKAPVKAMVLALILIGLGVFMVIQGGGFGWWSRL